MDSVVTKSIPLKIENNSISPIYFDLTVAPVNEIVHCFIRASKRTKKIYLILRFLQLCEGSRYAYAYKLKLDGKLLKSKDFKNIVSNETNVFLGNITIDQITTKYGQVNTQGGTDKIYLIFDLTVKCERIGQLQQLFLDIAAPELADFTFEIDDEKIPAHKFVLSARSPVFRRMFSNDCFKEMQESKMTIIDTSAIVFKYFLEFIYTARVIPNLSITGGIELIKLAEKYDIENLKRICEAILMKKLWKSDCLSMYMFAHQYNCSQEFIVETFQFVQKKYFIGKDLPPNLCDNPVEVQRLVSKMEEFDDTLKEVHEDLNHTCKKLKTI